MKDSYKLLIELKEKGFKTNGISITSGSGKDISLQIDKFGYYTFSHRMKNGKTRRCHLHRYIAYLKYGEELFKEGTQVRHLDGNPKNNNFNNILIGTASENMMDKHPLIRKMAAGSSKKYNHEEVIKMKNLGYSYKEIMEKFDIKSKGTISFIINKSMARGEILADTTKE